MLTGVGRECKASPISIDCVEVWCRLKETCLQTWSSTALPALSRMHAADSFRANKTMYKATQLLHAWRAYTATRAFKHALTTRATQYWMRCVVAKVWHAWEQRVGRKQRKQALAARAVAHSRISVLRSTWFAWQTCVKHGQQEKQALQVAVMHRQQVMALRGLRAFSESLHRWYTKRLAATHCKSTRQRCATCCLEQQFSIRASVTHSGAECNAC